MADPRLEKWARALVNYSVEVKPGQKVGITGGVAAAPLLREIYREVLAAGGFPVMLPVLDGLNAEMLLHGNDDQLAFLTPAERFLREEWPRLSRRLERLGLGLETLMKHRTEGDAS